MPDDLIPNPTEPSAEPQVESTPTQETPQGDSNDAAYDEELGSLLGEDTGTEETVTPKAETTQTPDSETTETEETAETPPASNEVFVTVSEQRVLERAGLEPDFYKGWSRQQIEKYVEKASKIQRDNDRAAAELGRLKPKQEEPRETPTEPADPKLNDQIAEAIKGLAEVYDEDTVKPLGAVLGQLVQSHSKVQSKLDESTKLLGAVGPLMNLVSEMAIDATLSGLKSQFPSLDKPEARKKVMDRFWTEWNTGAYSKEDAPLLDQIREAASNAVRVTFMNTTEQTAAATLVNKNRERVASQPRRGPTKAPPKPKTPDDIYDEAYEETMVSG